MFAYSVPFFAFPAGPRRRENRFPSAPRDLLETYYNRKGDEKMKRRTSRLLSTLLALCMVLTLMPGTALAAETATSYVIGPNNVTVPLANWPAGGASYGSGQCRAFAGMVYRTIWGQDFSSYRGTSDDMLRNVPAGSEREITAANTERFITAAEVGATIRITTDISGSDSNGTYLHSLILVQKDSAGLTVYDSVSSGVRLKRYTWSSFASHFAKYKYFKYIKWPGAAAFMTETAPTNAVLTANKTNCAAGDTITFTGNANNASYYSLFVIDESNTIVYSNNKFSTSTTWTPTATGTYRAALTAVNSVGNVSATALTINVYSGAPTAPKIELNTTTPIYGERVKISWYDSANAKSYSYRILKDNVVYATGSSAGSDSYSAIFPEGTYTVEVTAVNPFGSTTSSTSFTVSGCEASGQIGDNVTFMLNTKTGMLILRGTGATWDYGIGSNPMDVYKSNITSVYIEEGITVLGESLFQGYSNIKYIHFPTTLTKISKLAFALCSSLTGMIEEERGVLVNTNGLLVLPATTRTIGVLAFGYCTSLKNVVFGVCNDEIYFEPTSPGTKPVPFYGCADSLTLHSTGGIAYDDNFNPVNDVGYPWLGMILDHTVYFDVNGGNTLQGNDSTWELFQETYYLIEEIPTREGFTFLGWFTAPVGGSQVTRNTVVTNTGSHTLYAHWKPDEHTVTLDLSVEDIRSPVQTYSLMAGEGVRAVADDIYEITVDYWETYGNLPTPEMPGCSFVGWSTSPEGGEIITAESIYILDKDQVLYAVWEPNDREYGADRNSIDIKLSGIEDALVYEIPADVFQAEVSIANPTGGVIVCIASYTAEGRFIGIQSGQISNVMADGSAKLSFTIDNSKGTIGIIKVFSLDSFDNAAPLGEVAELPVW